MCVRLACGVRGACSNDVVVIVYYEGTSQLDPAIFESQFNHVFAIVQPIPGSGTPDARVRRSMCAVGVCGERVRTGWNLMVPRVVVVCRGRPG